jgi:putative endonuclease
MAKSGIQTRRQARTWLPEFNLHLAGSIVWYETCPDMYSAIAREKQIKGWRRTWKIELIERMNPGWLVLYGEIA